MAVSQFIADCSANLTEQEAAAGVDDKYLRWDRPPATFSLYRRRRKKPGSQSWWSETAACVQKLHEPQFWNIIVSDPCLMPEQVKIKYDANLSSIHDVQIVSEVWPITNKSTNTVSTIEKSVPTTGNIHYHANKQTTITTANKTQHPIYSVWWCFCSGAGYII